MKCLNSKIITIFICLQLALFPSLVFAAGNVGGWSMSNPVAQGASVVYDGAKNVIINGKDYIKKGTAKITPPASSVAKVLARGAAGYALSVAVEQLLGAVDWVLDPANNQIKYYPTDTKPVDPKDPSVEIFYYLWGDSARYASPYALCSAKGGDLYISGENFYCDGKFVYTLVNPIYDPNAQPDKEQKTIPLETVAQKVISNAESGDTNAQVATTAAAADIVAEAETDNVKARPIVNQLEQSASTENADADAQADANTATGSQTQNPSKPDTTDLKLEFPAFCGWAPVVCEAAQVVISFPTKVQGWADAVALAWSEFWQEPNLEKDKDTNLDVEEKELQDPSQFDQMYVQFGGQCPTFETSTITVGPISVPISLDLSALCDFALMVRPAVIGLGYLAGLAIVSNAIREA